MIEDCGIIPQGNRAKNTELFASLNEMSTPSATSPNARVLIPHAASQDERAP
jgi:hypothetical protein